MLSVPAPLRDRFERVESAYSSAFLEHSGACFASLWQGVVDGFVSSPGSFCEHLVAIANDTQFPWAAVALPVPFLHLIAEALAELPSASCSATHASSIADETTTIPALIAAERALRCTGNQRVFVDARRVRSSARHQQHSDEDLTLRCPAVSETLSLLIEACARRSDDALAAVDHFLCAAVPTQRQSDSLDRSLSPLSCGAESTTLASPSEQTSSGPIEVWRSALTSFELATALGITYSEDASTAAARRRLKSVLCWLLADAEVSSNGVRCRVVDYLLQLIIEHSAESHVSRDQLTPRCTNAASHDEDREHRLLDVSVAGLMAQLDGNSQLPTSAAASLISRAATLVSRHPAVLITDASFDPSGNEAEASSRCCLFVRSLIHFSATAMLAAVERRSPLSSDRLAGRRDVLQRVAGIWEALTRVRHAVPAVLDQATALDLMRLASIREQQEDVAGLANNTDSVDALRAASVRLHLVANQLEVVELSVGSLLQKLSSDAFSVALCAWLSAENARIADDIRYVLQSKKGMHSDIVEQSVQQSSVGTSRTRSTAAGITSTPSSRPMTPTLASSLGDAALVLQHSKERMSLSRVHPAAALYTTDLGLFGRAWSTLPNADRDSIDARSTYSLWVREGHLLSFIIAACDPDNTDSEMSSTPPFVVDEADSPLHMAPNDSLEPIPRLGSVVGHRVVAWRVLLFSFMVCPSQLHAAHFAAVLRFLESMVHRMSACNDASLGVLVVAATYATQALVFMIKFWVADASNSDASPTPSHSLHPGHVLTVLKCLELWNQDVMPKVADGSCEYVSIKLHHLVERIFRTRVCLQSVFEAVSSSGMLLRHPNNSHASTPRQPLSARLSSSPPAWHLLEYCYTNRPNLCVLALLHAHSSDHASSLSPLLDGLVDVLSQIVVARCGCDASTTAASVASASFVLFQCRRFYKMLNHLCSGPEYSSEAHNGTKQRILRAFAATACTKLPMHGIQAVVRHIVETEMESNSHQSNADFVDISHGLGKKKSQTAAFLSNAVETQLHLCTHMAAHRAEDVLRNDAEVQSYFRSVSASIIKVERDLLTVSAWLFETVDEDAADALSAVSKAATISKRRHRLITFCKDLEQLSRYAPRSIFTAVRVVGRAIASFRKQQQKHRAGTAAAVVAPTDIVMLLELLCGVSASNHEQLCDPATQANVPQISLTAGHVWVREILDLVDACCVVEPLSEGDASPPRSVSVAPGLEGVHALVLRILHLQLSLDCTPRAFAVLTAWVATKRSAAVVFAASPVPSSTAQGHPDDLWYSHLAVVLSAMRCNTERRVPRRFYRLGLGMDDSRNALCGKALLRATPPAFPTPEGFAVSCWLFPRHHHGDHMGTMVLVGLHHPIPLATPLSRKKEIRQCITDVIQHGVLDAIQCSAFEIVLQRCNTGEEEEEGNSDVSQQQASEGTPCPAATRCRYRVYLRCAEQQFAVCFPKGFVPAERWTHLVVSATYDESMRLCRAVLSLNGAQVDELAMTPPRFRPGIMIVGAGRSHSRSSVEVRDACAPAAFETSDADVGLYKDSGCLLDAPFSGYLASFVLWREHLTPEDVAFLYRQPQVDVLQDAATFSNVRCMGGRRATVQLVAGRTPADVHCWSGSRGSVATGGDVELCCVLDSIFSCGGVVSAALPYLCSITPIHRVQGIADTMPQPEDRTGMFHSNGEHPAGKVPVLQNPSSSFENKIVVATTVELVVESLLRSNSASSPTTALDDDDARMQHASIIPDVMSVLMACCSTRSSIADCVIVMRSLALVLPSVPHLISSLNASAVCAPIVVLLRKAAADEGYRHVFDAVCDLFIFNFTLWSRCDAASRNDMCRMFLEAMRSDRIVVRSLATRRSELVPRLLGCVSTHFRGPQEKALRMSRLLLVDTCSLLCLQEDSSSSTANSDMARIPEAFGRLLRDALEAAGTGNTSAAAERSPALGQAPWLARNGSGSVSFSRGDSLLASSHSPSPCSAMADNPHLVFVYEVVMSIAGLLCRASDLQLSRFVASFAECRMQNDLLKAIFVAWRIPSIQRCVVVSLGVLLHHAPSGGLRIELQPGLSVFLPKVSGEAFAMAPLAAALSGVECLSPLVCTALWELATECPVRRTALLLKPGRTSKRSSSNRRCSKQPAHRTIDEDVVCGDHSALAVPSVVPLLIELLADELIRQVHLAHAASTSRVAAPGGPVLRSSTSLDFAAASRDVSLELDVPVTLARIQLAIDARPLTLEIPEILVNAVSVHTLCNMHRLMVFGVLWRESCETDGDVWCVPRLLGAACGRIVVQSVGTSWLVLWQCARSLRLSLVPRPPSAAGPLSNDTAATGHPNSTTALPDACDALLTLSYFVAQAVHTAAVTLLSESRATQLSEFPLGDQKEVLFSGTPPPRLGSSGLLSNSAAADFVSRIIPLCALATAWVVNPVLNGAALRGSDGEEPTIAVLVVCLSVLGLVSAHPEVYAAACLDADVSSCIRDEAESVVFSELFSKTSLPGMLCSLVRCSLMLLQSISQPAASAVVRRIPPILRQSLGVGSTTAGRRHAASNEHKEEPSIETFVCRATNDLLMHMCRVRRLSAKVVFSSDESRGLPRIVAVVLSAVQGLLNASVEPISRRQRDNFSSALCRNDCVVKSVAKLLHRGLGYFWAAVEEHSARLFGVCELEPLANWVLKSHCDLQLLFSRVITSSSWESLTRLLQHALPPRVGDDLVVSVPPIPVDGVAMRALGDSFERQRRVDDSMWCAAPSMKERRSVRWSNVFGMIEQSNTSTGEDRHSGMFSVVRHADLSASEVASCRSATRTPPLRPPTHDSAEEGVATAGQSPEPCDPLVGTCTNEPLGSSIPKPSERASAIPQKDVVMTPEDIHRARDVGRDITRSVRKHRSPWMSWTASRYLLCCTSASSRGVLVCHTQEIEEQQPVRVLHEIAIEGVCPTLRMISSKTIATTYRRAAQQRSMGCTPLCTPRFGGSTLLTPRGPTQTGGESFTLTHTATISGSAIPDAATSAALNANFITTVEAEVIAGLMSWPSFVRISADGVLCIIAAHDVLQHQHYAVSTSTWFGEAIRAQEEVACLLSAAPPAVSWPLSEIRDCVPGFRVRMRRTGVLLRHQSGDGLLLNFVDEQTAMRVARSVAKHTVQHPPAASIPAMVSHRRWSVLVGDSQPATPSFGESSRPASEVRRIQSMWLNGSMSNFEYLMRLNSLANRSVHDLSQYPIMPWVLANFTEITLDMSQPSALRNLEWPIGAQTEKQRDAATRKFNDMRDLAAAQHAQRRDGLLEDGHDAADHSDPSVVPYHHATLYSSPSSVLHFLVRLEPYTSMHRDLHDGSYDHVDRMFQSVATTYHNGVFECVPEMYYLPEMFVGSCSRASDAGDSIGDVRLPPWARGSPWKFVAGMRATLESPLVTEHLPKWIDLVFGFRQQRQYQAEHDPYCAATGDDAAVRRLNTFHPMLGEQWATQYIVSHGASYDSFFRSSAGTLDEQDAGSTTTQDHLAALARGMWDNMGQLPVQLFDAPHPTPSWAAPAAANAKRTFAASAQRRLLETSLIRGLKAPASVIEEQCRLMRMRELPHESVAPTSGLPITDCLPRHVVVSLLPHASGRLYMLFATGYVAITTWKGIPGGGGSTADSPVFYAPFSVNAVPLCLLPLARITSDRECADHGVSVLYSSTLKPAVLFMCSLVSDDFVAASPTLEDAPPVRVASEEAVPDSSSPIRSAYVAHSFEKDLQSSDVDDFGTCVVTCQANGSVTLWRCGDSQSALSGLTITVRLFGHVGLVTSFDANVFVNLCASVSCGYDTQSCMVAGQPCVLLHDLHAGSALCRLRLPIAEDVEGAMVSATTSVAVMHAPYAMVLLAHQNSVFCYTTNIDCNAADDNSSGAPLLWKVTALPYRAVITRGLDSGLVIATTTWTCLFNDWVFGLQEFLVSCSSSGVMKPSTSHSSAGASGSFPTGTLPPSALLLHHCRAMQRNSGSAISSPTEEAARSPVSTDMPTPTANAPVCNVSVARRATLAGSDVVPLHVATALDPRSRNTVGPSSLRVIAVTVYTDGSVSVFV